MGFDIQIARGCEQFLIRFGNFDVKVAIFNHHLRFCETSRICTGLRFSKSCDFSENYEA